MLILAVAIASCSAGESAPTAEAVENRHASDQPDPASPGRVLFARITPSDASRHYVIDADGSTQRPFAPGKAFETRHLSPDGAKLAIVAMNDQGGVIVGGTIGVDGKGFRLFESADPTLHLACGVWAPHGRMACEGWDDADPSRSGIYTVRASDGSGLQRVTHGRDVPCDYSPDGTQLAFVRAAGPDEVETLTVMDADGTHLRPLFRGVTLSGITCDWSPDGRSILTESDGTLVVVSPTGKASSFSGEEIDGYASGGVWSPDGARILFSMALEGEQFDVYSAAADGSDVVRITDSDLLEEALAWLP